MKLYLNDDEFESLEERDSNRPSDLVELAWQLRQRDSGRATLLANRAEFALDSADRRLAARIALIRAEVAGLDGEHGKAEQQAALALQEFEALTDPVGQGDALLALALFGTSMGQARAATLLERASALCAQAADTERLQFARAWAALRLADTNPQQALGKLRQWQLWPLPSGAGATLASLVHATVAASLQAAEPARAALLADLASEQGRRGGLALHALDCARAAGAGLEALGDLDGAMRRLEWACARARASGWAPASAACLAHLGALLGHAGALERSVGVLQEALNAFAGLPDCPAKAACYCELGHTEFRLGRFEAAVANADEGMRLSQQIQAHARLGDCLLLKVRALAALKRPDAALSALDAARALVREQNMAGDEFKLGALQAELRQAGLLPTVPAATLLADLDALQTLGHSLPHWQPSSAVFRLLSRAYEGAGDSLAALELARSALTASTREAEAQRTAGQALAAAAHEIDAQRSADQHAQLLQASSLQQLNTLEHLQQAGFELSSALSENGVSRLVQSHARAVLGMPAIDWLPPGARAALGSYCEPVQRGDQLLGTLVVQGLSQPSPRQRLLLRILCDHAALALDKLQAQGRLTNVQQQLESQSLIDPMTGLRNRRFLAQSLESDVLLSLRRYDSQDAPPQADADLIFLLIDLDHFREVNDEYGHAAGDAVLVQLAERLRPLFREADHLVRWGGEEFLIVARGSGRGRAAELAERVRHAVASHHFILPDGSPLAKTCSIGFTCFPFATQAPRAMGWQDVVAMADIALYTAKRGGRNAWVGLGHGDTQLRPLLLQRAKSHLRHLIDSTELHVQSSLPLQALRGIML